MSQTTYGSITIVDITDVGKLSVFPTSNQPLTVVYNPDDHTYSPNWGSSNLVLEANAYYNNTALTTTDATITWTKKVGIGSEEALGTGETVQNDGSLVVSQNKFTPTTSMITYIVHVAYQEPTTGANLSAEGQITFSMISLASDSKTCSIIGDTVFKYNTDQILVSDPSITLTAQLSTNLHNPTWQYRHKDANDQWIWSTYPNSGTSSTLTVNASDNVFTNDHFVTIKVIAHDVNNNEYFDIHTIVKLKDGVAGSGAVATLTNDNQMIPFPSEGTPSSSAYSQATSTIVIYDDGEVDTQNWTITHTNATNVTFTSSATTYTNDTISITGLTSDVGSVTFHCVKGNQIINKVFSVVKVVQGQDGHSPEFYSIETENGVVAINRTNPSTSSESIVYTPSSLKIYAKKTVGSNNGNVVTDYNGRLQIICGENTHTQDLTASQTYATISSSWMAEALSDGYIKINLFETGSSAADDLLDTQTIAIVTDGSRGEPGQPGNVGASAFNVILGNQNDIINCNHDNETLGQTIDIPFTAYQGITQVACTVTSTLPNLFGVAPEPITPSTGSNVGHIIYNIPSGQPVTASTGSMSLTFRATNADNEYVDVIHNYTWSRTTAPLNGSSAKLFELYAPTGNIFTSRNEQTLDIKGRLMDGSTTVTGSATNWTWYLYTGSSSAPDGDGYEQITSSTEGYTLNGSTMRVSNSAVNGFASYKCKCTYDTTYTAYYVLYDKLDPVIADVFSSIGDKIVNKQGIGAWYVVLTDTRNGQELDPMPTTTFATADPSPATIGQWYYNLDSTHRTVTLKRYTSEGWKANNELPASERYTPSATYSWTFRDANGNLTVPSGMATSGKVIYIDGSFVQQKLTGNVAVTI